MRARALMPHDLVGAVADPLGLLSAGVAERVANNQTAVTGEALYHDAGELADRGAARQLANEGRRATVRVATELFGKVQAVVAGHDPRQWVGIAVLVNDSAVAERDHGDAPGVAGRLADHDGPPGQNAAGRQHGNLPGSRGDTDCADAGAWPIDSEEVEVIGSRRRRPHPAKGSSVVRPHHGRVGGY